MSTNLLLNCMSNLISQYIQWVKYKQMLALKMLFHSEENLNFFDIRIPDPQSSGREFNSGVYPKPDMEIYAAKVGVSGNRNISNVQCH